MLSLLLACSVAAQDGNMTILGDLKITGAMRTTAIRSGNVVIDGSIQLTHAISGESLTAGHVTMNNLETVAISSPTGVLHVNGELSLGASPLSSNGTVRAASFIQQDVKQWALAYHDDFEQENSAGWNTNHTSSCDGVDHHLAGHCKELENGAVKKTFDNLPEHKYIRLQARYHFLDSWEGEAAFAKIGDRTVWTDTNDVRGVHGDALNLCGAEFADLKFSIPIDVTIPHSGSDVTVTFGSSLDEHPCNESFGVDDVMILVR